MDGGLRSRVRATVARLRRLKRRELREFRAWIENTRNLVHVTILIAVPLLLALVTELSKLFSARLFVVFPPLASGTFTLFADPEGRYASPVKFVGGLITGAVCGGAALVVSAELFGRPVVAEPGQLFFTVSPLAAALSVFLTGALTWAFDFEEPSAFSTALLALIVPTNAGGSQVITVVGLYALGIAVSSTIVAGAFYVWRERFYERRARYLYQSTKGDDHILVPMRGGHADATAMFGARLAAAHDAGKVVLLDVVDDESVAAAEEAMLSESGQDVQADGGPDETIPEAVTDAVDDDNEAEARAAAETATELESRAHRIETEVGVPCQVVVAAGGDDSGTTMDVAHRTNCDLIVTPYEEHHGSLSPFVRDLFRGDTDVVAHRSTGERTDWKRVLVPVRKSGDVAHAMVDFALRLTGKTGHLAVCHCIDGDDQRRSAEAMLADLVETFTGNIETRVANADIEDFLAANDGQYDLVIIGSSADRSAASRFVSPPTFERIKDLDADVAVLDRNFRY